MSSAKRTRTAITVLSILFLLTVAGTFVAASVYFEFHFFPNTYIGYDDISCKTPEEIENRYERQIRNYNLALVLRDKKVERISAEDIGLKPEYGNALREALDNQHGYAFILSLFKKTVLDDVPVELDEEQYAVTLAGLECFDKANEIAPVDAHIEYVNGTYVIIDEVMGNTLNREKTEEVIREAILSLRKEIDLDKYECYVNPEVTAEDTTILQAANEANEYLLTNVQYGSGGKVVKLDSDRIVDFIKLDDKGWLVLDDEGHPVIKDEEIDKFVALLQSTYDTYKNNQIFHTSYGKDVTVRNGGIGYMVDAKAEKEAVYTALKEKTVEQREPVFSRRAYSSGKYQYGNSYIEVNLTAQHVFVYIKGSKVFETDCVTGSVSRGTTTRVGMFTIKYKQKNATLRGDNYTSFVYFWMPFDGGIGLHDATWRNYFGGSIYKTSGSHGCVNLPYAAAEKIYGVAYAGMPVIVYELAGTEKQADSASGN
jgi:lipoprotein-anchoring transpeptidase ErfK/SrfK